MYLKIDHPLHDYSLVMLYLGLDSLVNRGITAILRVLNKLVDGFIDSPEFLALINFKVFKFNVCHTYPFSVPKCTAHESNKPILRMMDIANRDPSSML